MSNPAFVVSMRVATHGGEMIALSGRSGVTTHATVTVSRAAFGHAIGREATTHSHEGALNQSLKLASFVMQRPGLGALLDDLGALLKQRGLSREAMAVHHDPEGADGPVLLVEVRLSESVDDAIEAVERIYDGLEDRHGWGLLSWVVIRPAFT